MRFLCLLLCGLRLGVFLVLEVCALVTWLVPGFICCVSFFVLLQFIVMK